MCLIFLNSTVELRKDIEEMEKEKEIVAKRIERMQRKARPTYLTYLGHQTYLKKYHLSCQVEGTVNEDAMLGVAKKLRQEREREKELHAQKGDQRTAIQHIEQRVQRMEAKLKDSRQQVECSGGRIEINQ